MLILVEREAEIPHYNDFVIQSISLSPSNSGTVGVSPHWRRVRFTPGSLLLTGMHPEYPGRAPKARLWHHAGASGCTSSSSGLHRLSRGFSLARRPVSDCTSLSAVRYTLDYLSRACPSLRNAPRLPLLRSFLQRWVRSTVGAAILYLLSRPDVGGLPSLSPGQSVCLLYH